MTSALVALFASAVFGGSLTWALVSRLEAKLSVLRDIARVDHEDALDHIERIGAASAARGAMLAAVAEQSPVGLVSCDTERILYTNAAAIRICGMDASGLPFGECIHPDDLAEGLEVVRANDQDGVANLAYRNRWLTPEGRAIPLVWTATPYVDGLSYCTVARDG